MKTHRGQTKKRGGTIQRAKLKQQGYNEKLRGGKPRSLKCLALGEVRRARYLWSRGSLETSMHFGMLIGTRFRHLSFLSVTKEMISLVEDNQHHNFPRKVGFCLNTRIWGKWSFLWTWQRVSATETPLRTNDKTYKSQAEWPHRVKPFGQSHVAKRKTEASKYKDRGTAVDVSCYSMRNCN